MPFDIGKPGRYDYFGFGFLLFECKSKRHGNITSIFAVRTLTGKNQTLVSSFGFQ